MVIFGYSDFHVLKRRRWSQLLSRFRVFDLNVVPVLFQGSKPITGSTLVAFT
jgi:hypothetical protein